MSQPSGHQQPQLMSHHTQHMGQQLLGNDAAADARKRRRSAVIDLSGGEFDRSHGIQSGMRKRALSLGASLEGTKAEMLESLEVLLLQSWDLHFLSVR